MKTLTINVPDELQEEVDAWADGESYVLNVTQTGEGTFDLDSAGEPAAEEEPKDEAEYGHDKMKKKMPATVAILIGKK